MVRKVLNSKLAIHVLALSRPAVERLAATNSGIMADHFPADPLEPPVRWHAPVITVGAVGFCAGGGNCWHLALHTEALAVAVAFYGAPVPPIDGLERLASPVLAIYAELDRTLTRSVLPVIARLEERQKPFGFHLYAGTNHAFHNDTGANYQRLAACDAWCKTAAFFQTHVH